MKRRSIFSASMVLTLAFSHAWSQELTGGKPPQLVKPYMTKSADNGPDVIPAPAGFFPKAPNGFHVSVFATGFDEPRWLAVSPAGDIFLADSHAGKVYVLRDPGHTGKATGKEVFAEGLNLPFGIAFHQNYVYVGDTDAVLRFQYDPATSKKLGGPEKIMDLPPYGSHWTRTLAFSPDGKKLFIAVGSHSNIGIETDPRRAAVNVCDPDGKNCRVFASGLRNAVGLAFNPESGVPWVDVNERDELGDNVPPDYFTHIVDGGFYGWPYSYIGRNVDDRVKPQRPDLVATAIVPDVLLGPHVAPLESVFYEAQQFPAKYLHGAFLAEHGSWNRRERNGYQVVFIPFQDGMPVGPPTPFLTGFVPDLLGKGVYGRVVGVAVAPDGSLLVSDDGMNLIWRVSYHGN
jgi:glucose/arabinose dehydrogenase